MTSTSKLIGCFVYLLMAVEAMEEQVQSAILRQSVIVFSEGISTPSKSDWTQDQHWVQKIGSENLHMKGKEQLRSLGEMQRRGMDAGGLMSLMEKDVVVYTQDRNISIIGSYYFLQGLFTSKPASSNGNGVTDPTGKMTYDPVVPMLLDVPIITNHNKYDPVLMAVGPTCPNLYQGVTKFKETEIYKKLDSNYSQFISKLSSKVYTSTQKKVSSLEDAVSFFEYFISEQLINGATEVELSEADVKTLTQLHSSYRYHENFASLQVAQGGTTMLMNQIKKDFLDKANIEFRVDSDKESLFRSNKNKLVTVYSASSTVLANLLINLNLTSPECTQFDVESSLTKCAAWPHFGSLFRMDLYEVPSTSTFFVRIYYNGDQQSLGYLTQGPLDIPLHRVIGAISNSLLDNFNSFCGAEWLIGKKVVKTFMGLVFFNILIISLAVMLIVIIVFLKAKIKNLQSTKELAELDSMKTHEQRTLPVAEP